MLLFLSFKSMGVKSVLIKSAPKHYGATLPVMVHIKFYQD